MRSEKLTSSLSDGLEEHRAQRLRDRDEEPAHEGAEQAAHPADDHDIERVTEADRPNDGENGRSGEASAPAAPTHAAPTPNATRRRGARRCR